MLGGSSRGGAYEHHARPRPPDGVEDDVGEQNRGEDESLHPGYCLRGPCSFSRDPYTSAAAAATPPPPQSNLLNRRGESNNQGLTPLLLSTASAARGRRRDGSVSKGNTSTHNDSTKHKQHNQIPIRNRPHRAASDLVLNVAVMEEVHGVDVSWLHHPSKGMETAYRAEERHNTNTEG